MAPAPPVLATLTRSVGAAAAAGSDATGAGGPVLVSGGSAATGVGRKCGVLSENTARGLKLAMSLASCEGPALAMLLTTKYAPIGNRISSSATMRATGRSAPGPNA